MLGHRDQPDKTRLCPSCRMDISILATKCRFCGENVGRPKDEQRKMTVDDLGGEKASYYAPSSSVMEALESFRLEETDAEEQDGGGKGRDAKAAADAQRGAGEALPDLDERSRALASVALPRATQATPVPRAASRRASSKASAQPTWMKKVGVLGGFVAAVIILYFGTVKVAAVMRERNRAPVPVVTVLPNPAKDMLERNDAPLEILQAAFNAKARQDVPENVAILSQARARVAKAVQDALNAKPFAKANLDRASEYIGKALDVDPNDEFRALKQEVDRDSAAIIQGIVVARINYNGGDPDASTATITVTLPNGQREQVDVRRGDVLWKDEQSKDGRFVVERIGRRSVRLDDKVRNDRVMDYDLSGAFPTGKASTG